MTTPTLLAIDQGTTSTRAILFDATLTPLHVSQRPLRQILPGPGWVEHDPEEIWRAVLDTCRAVLARAETPPVAIGITNQRETTIVWDRASGRPIHNAIVWQDRRTAEACRALAPHAAEVTATTGLVLDPYFSATKIAWLLDHTGRRDAAERGELAFGTVDSFLLWRLTEGRVHATDATNAARTGLFDIGRQEWSAQMGALFGVPSAMLPEVRDTVAAFGATSLFGGALTIAAMAGDQHAALVGHACFAPGEMKSTYGTGTFLIANTGTVPVPSRNRLLTTVAYRFGGSVTYGLEGSIFATGAAVQWLRDGLGLLRDAADSERLAASVPDSGGVVVVPALTGLGAPDWDADARGLICGIDRGTTAAHIVRATLDAVCHQTRDLIDAMTADGMAAPARLRVDGGMTANDWLMGRLADLTGLAVERAGAGETTAWGAAALAGLGVGVFADLDAIAALRQPERVFRPALDAVGRATAHRAWRAAVARARSDRAMVLR